MVLVREKHWADEIFLSFSVGKTRMFMESKELLEKKNFEI